MSGVGGKAFVTNAQEQERLYNQEKVQLTAFLETAKKEREAYERQHGETDETKKFKELEKTLEEELKRTAKINDSSGWTNGSQIHRIYAHLQKTLQDNEAITIEQKELNLSKFPTWIYKILAYFCRELAGYIQTNQELTLDRQADLHIIPIRSPITHSGCVVVDNVNKKICVFEPEGQAYEVPAVASSRTKEELIKKLFNESDANWLLSKNYSLVDCNRKQISTSQIDVFDKIVYNNNIPQNIFSTCAIQTAQFCKDYIESFRKNPKHELDYGTFVSSVVKKQILHIPYISSLGEPSRANGLFYLRKKLKFAKDLFFDCSLTRKMPKINSDLESLQNIGDKNSTVGPDTQAMTY